MVGLGIGAGVGFLKANEGPISPADGLRRLIGMVLDRQRGRWVVGVGGRVGKMVPVGQKEVLSKLVTLELTQDASGQRAVWSDRFRRLQPDQSRRGRHVGLPAAPHHGVAVAHQKTVACLQGRQQIGGRWDVIQAEGGLTPPVDHVKEQAPVALARIGGL